MTAYNIPAAILVSLTSTTTIKDTETYGAITSSTGVILTATPSQALLSRTNDLVTFQLSPITITRSDGLRTDAGVLSIGTITNRTFFPAVPAQGLTYIGITISGTATETPVKVVVDASGNITLSSISGRFLTTNGQYLLPTVVLTWMI